MHGGTVAQSQRISFQYISGSDPAPLDNYVRLGFGGPVLSSADAERGLLVLDGTWRLAERMENVYHDVPIRSLPACETAYPRVSKIFDDPLGGLATIEAVFLAYRLLERPVDGLLNSYYWAEEFLRKNSFGVSAVQNATDIPSDDAVPHSSAHEQAHGKQTSGPTGIDQKEQHD